MRYGIVIPKGDPHAVAGLAREAEDNGWDGAFYWDGLFISGPDGVPWPAYDPWVVMAAMAMRTERVRIGAFVTPLSRRRPWKVAREALTLDHLSGGRLTLAVGLGAVDDGGFSRVGEATERKARAERLDESLAIMEGLWQGQPFAFSGTHFQLEEVTCLPRPLQRPRIPVWVVTAWPRPASLRRAMRWDGAIPARRSPGGDFSARLAPEDLRALREYAGQHRPPGAPFEVVLEGVTPGDVPPPRGRSCSPWPRRAPPGGWRASGRGRTRWRTSAGASARAPLPGASWPLPRCPLRPGLVTVGGLA